MAESIEARVEELARFLERYREKGPRPILWVGAGASAAAGFPTLAGLEPILRRELPGVEKSGYELVDAYVDAYSRADLAGGETDPGVDRRRSPARSRCANRR